jgi:hypothetical protein
LVLLDVAGGMVNTGVLENGEFIGGAIPVAGAEAVETELGSGVGDFAGRGALEGGGDFKSEFGRREEQGRGIGSLFRFGEAWRAGQVCRGLNGEKEWSSKNGNRRPLAERPFRQRWLTPG